MCRKGHVPQEPKERGLVNVSPLGLNLSEHCIAPLCKRQIDDVLIVACSSLRQRVGCQHINEET